MGRPTERLDGFVEGDPIFEALRFACARSALILSVFRAQSLKYKGLVRLSKIVLVAALGLSCQSCVANKAYRWSAPDAPAIVPLSTSANGAKYDLAFLEFDDMGEFWTIGDLNHFDDNPEASQLSEVLDLIRERKSQGNLVVMAFIHGWHNNASKYDEKPSHEKSLAGFKSLLQARATADPNHHYLGVFIGWRGQSLAADPFLTYWDRRDAAMRVSSPSFSEAIFRLMFTTKGTMTPPEVSSGCQPADAQSEKAQFIIIGHSFGARVLENAVAQPFLTMLLEREAQTVSCVAEAKKAGVPLASPHGAFRSPADLIVLLNSANDAFRTKAMIEAMKRMDLRVVRAQPGTPEGEKHTVLAESASAMDSYGPLILSITSKGDWATGRVMPVAQAISSVDKRFRSYDKNGEELGQDVTHAQEFYYLNSEGNVTEFLTHRVRRVGPSNCSEPRWPYFNGGDGCYLVEPVQEWNNTPFWVMRVSTRIIPNHTDVFKPSVIDLLESVLDRYSVPSSETHLSVQ